MDCQKLLFDWIAHQHGLTGATFLALGLLYGFYGVQAIRLLVLAPAVGLGCLIGLFVAPLLQLAPLVPAIAGALLLGAASAAWPKFAVITCGGATWAALGGYLATQFGLGHIPVLISLALVGAGGTVLTAVSLRPMIMVTTALQGSSLMVMGFVGVATAVLPSLGYTFRGFAQDYSLVVPVLLTMLVVTSYSHQGSAQQGDILTGVRPWPGI